MRKKADDAVSRARDDHERKLKALVDRVDKLTKEIKAMREAHTEEEAAARKKKIKAAAELSAIVNKYDDSMITLSDTMKALQLQMQQVNHIFMPNQQTLSIIQHSTQ